MVEVLGRVRVLPHRSLEKEKDGFRGRCGSHTASIHRAISPGGTSVVTALARSAGEPRISAANRTTACDKARCTAADESMERIDVRRGLA